MSDVLTGEVISSDERIRELDEEIGGRELAGILDNPAQLKSLLNLDAKQSRNVRALVVGAGAAASVKYLGPSVGDTLAAIVGAGVSAYLAKKVLG